MISDDLDSKPIVKTKTSSSSSHSSRKSQNKGTNTRKQQQHHHEDNQPIIVDASKSEVINYDLQVRNSNSDSGLSSPASSIDKHNKNLVPTPLSTAKPRSRPKSQHIPRSSIDQETARRLSVHTQNYDHMKVDNDQQVYTAIISNNDDNNINNQDNITYADLDPKAFMIPHNKVLPTKGRKNSSSDSTYVEISSKPHFI